MIKRVYMDNNATTPLHPEVKRSLTEALDVFGNASSLHWFGREAHKAIEGARRSVASFISADPSEIVFAGSGSEANNTVLNIFACKCPTCKAGAHMKRTIITTKVEHPCVLRTSECLEERGYLVKYIGVDKYGKVKMDELEKAITGGICLVSVMLANNEIGTIMDIRKIADMAHEKGALVHTDAVQGAGKVPVNAKDLDVDFLTISAHKIYGPKGIGALYVRKGAPFCPMIHGGHQEQGRRAGTENTLGIIGFGKAVEIAKNEMSENSSRLRTLRDKLRSGIERDIPDIIFNGHPVDCLPNTLNVSFSGAEGESILLYLDLEGIAVSTGSACASGSLDPSHVLLATGLGPEHAHGSIRFSLGRFNTEEDVDYVLGKLPGVISKVRKMSTAYDRTK